MKRKTVKRALGLAFALCLCVSAVSGALAAEVTDSGSAGVSDVTLSTTEDGSFDGLPAATAMSVTVPTVLPVAVGPDGSVLTAENCSIVNRSYGPVKVSSVLMTAESGWHLADFTANMAEEKVDSCQIGFALTIGGGRQLCTDGSDPDCQALLEEAQEGCYLTGAGNQEGCSAEITYDAVVSAVSEAVTNTGVASVVFVIEWDT